MERFGEEAQTHYNFMDRQQGYIMVAASTMLCGAATIMTANPDGRMENTPLMRLAIGVVTPKMQPFADIREITETATEMHRQDAAGNVSKG